MPMKPVRLEGVYEVLNQFAYEDRTPPFSQLISEWAFPRTWSPYLDAIKFYQLHSHELYSSSFGKWAMISCFRNCMITTGDTRPTETFSLFSIVLKVGYEFQPLALSAGVEIEPPLDSASPATFTFEFSINMSTPLLIYENEWDEVGWNILAPISRRYLIDTGATYVSFGWNDAKDLPLGSLIHFGSQLNDLFVITEVEVSRIETHEFKPSKSVYITIPFKETVHIHDHVNCFCWQMPHCKWDSNKE